MRAARQPSLSSRDRACRWVAANVALESAPADQGACTRDKQIARLAAVRVRIIFPFLGGTDAGVGEVLVEGHAGLDGASDRAGLGGAQMRRTCSSERSSGRRMVTSLDRDATGMISRDKQANYRQEVHYRACSSHSLETRTLQRTLRLLSRISSLIAIANDSFETVASRRRRPDSRSGEEGQLARPCRRLPALQQSG